MRIADCYLWTPVGCVGKVLLEDKNGEKMEILEWREGSTPNRNFPIGIGNGNNGINRDQEQVIGSTAIKPLSIDITKHVRPNSHYKVHFLYQHGNNGAWIQGIRVRIE